MIQLLSRNLHEGIDSFFMRVGRYLHLLWIEAESAKDNPIVFHRKIYFVMGKLDKLLSEWNLFNHYITKMFMTIHPNMPQTSHKCLDWVYVDKEHKRLWAEACEQYYFSRNLQRNSTNDQDKHIWTCILISLILSQRYDILPDELVKKLFENIQFKALLSFTNVLLYEKLRLRILDGKDHIDYALQTFTNPNIALKIFQDKTLRQKWLSIFYTYTTLSTENLQTHLNLSFNIKANFSYLLKTPTIEYLLYHWDLSELMEHYHSMAMTDAVRQRSEHIEYDYQGYNFALAYFISNSLSVIYTLVKEIGVRGTTK